MLTASRRWFLTTSGSGAAALVLGSLFSRSVRARSFGELAPDAGGLLDLPDGFSYVIVERVGDPMDDGFGAPALPDGMACFEGAAGTLVLTRNHELAQPSGNEPDEVYTADSGGGVTRVVVDAETGERISSNWVLAGTRRNCAGGPSPWGWLSCEENVDSGHGYVFACDPTADQAQAPNRVPGYGRFNHEAVAIDPDTLVAYLTEDRPDGCLYRFVPTNPDDPFEGTLQALRVVGDDAYPTEVMTTGDQVEVAWVDVPDPDPDIDSVRYQARDLGAASVRRGEGIWYFDAEIYFVATIGGPAGFGQIFRLIDGDEGGTLECVVASSSAAEMNFPDNITVSPWGQVFAAEDADANCRLLVIDDEGGVHPFARFTASQSELAGACFSPDGKILFVNAQADGYTFAITGPFPDPSEGGTDTDATDTDSDGSTSDDGDSAGETGNDGESEASTSTDPDGPDGSDGTADGSGTDTSGDSAGASGDNGGCNVGADSKPGAAAASVLVAAALWRRSNSED